VVAVDEQDDIALTDLFLEDFALLWDRGGVDDGGGDIFRGAQCWWEGDGRQDGLEGRGDEGVFDEAGEEGGLADLLVAAYAYSDWGGLVSGGALIGKK